MKQEADPIRASELPPHHLIHHPNIALDDAHDLRRDILIHIVRHRNTRKAVADQGDGHIDALEQPDRIDAAEDEAALVQGLGALGRCADADGWEGVADASEEGGLLGEGAAVGDHAECVHLQTVVIMEAQGFMPNHARIQNKAARLQPLPGARVAAVEDGHIILRRHLVDCIEERQEVLFRVEVLLAVGAQEDVLALFEVEASVDVAGLDLGEVVVQHLGHRRAGHVSALLRQSAVRQIAARVLGIGHIDIGDNVDNAAVRLLRQALVLAAVAGLHVEDRDVQPLRADDAEAAVRVAQHQHRIGLDLHHQLVTLRDDIAHGLAEVRAHGVHVHIRVRQLQVLEKHPIQVVIIVLPRMRQDRVEVLPALVNHGRQPDNLRTRPHDDQKLQLSVILEFCHMLLFFRLPVNPAMTENVKPAMT